MTDEPFNLFVPLLDDPGDPEVRWRLAYRVLAATVSDSYKAPDAIIALAGVRHVAQRLAEALAVLESTEKQTKSRAVA